MGLWKSLATDGLKHWYVFPLELFEGVVDRSVVYACEQKWIDALRAIKEGYNALNSAAEAPPLPGFGTARVFVLLSLLAGCSRHRLLAGDAASQTPFICN